MAKQLQLFFDEVSEKKQEEKEIVAMFKDALANNEDYQIICEEIKRLQERKNQIKFAVLESLGSNAEKLEEIKSEIKAEKEALTDEAISTLMRCETVEVEDKYGNKYEPVFSVRFRKVQ
jgi:predicted P-loop ATPase/GTPase